MRTFVRPDCPKCHGTSLVMSDGTRSADGKSFTFTATMPCDCVKVTVVVSQPSPGVTP